MSQALMPRPCWLCGRPLGRRIEQHHPVPRRRGGRITVPVHPVCHRTIRAIFSNAELARLPDEAVRLAPAMQRFLTWIATKPPDFNAPTARPRRDK